MTFLHQQRSNLAQAVTIGA